MQKNRSKIKLFKKKYQDLINQINLIENDLKNLNDSELRNQNLKLRQQFKDKKSLEFLSAKSFALTREASFRTLGLRHFDVQLGGGLVLNDGKIAEMKTGEGKTLVATLPACLNGLSSNGVHIVTVNEYLASRDQTSMGQIYRFLGFDIGLIKNKSSKFEKKENYNSDITYVTNSELAFDFLRDNMILNPSDRVLKPFNYCIIDEVDSILIDEAQVPLILANNVETPVDKYIIASEIVDYLEINTHYKTDEKNQNVVLTEIGSKQVEAILSIQDLYDIRDPWIPYILNAIKANTLFFNDIHYLIRDNRIIIIDQFTGRLMPDRRWGNGIHQAIEAKEKLPIREKSEVSASITYQNFFLLYPKLAGMTGTGKTAELEFNKIYNLSVSEVPTHRKTLRKDLPDLIYKDQFSKWSAIAQTCNKIFSKGQPILIGTTTVEKSEMLAQLLDEYKLFYQVLNAKPENIRRESEIVAQAGKQKTITIATNMAGRGTDIILGGNINFDIQKKIYNVLTLLKNYSILKNYNLFKFFSQTQFKYNSQKFLSNLFSIIIDKKFTQLSDIEILELLQDENINSMSSFSYKYSIKFLVDEALVQHKKKQNQENQIVKNLGGLYIIGTERNNSRRVDNQLRGRCGRQGDPGTSRFFLSLDDNLLRLFGGNKMQNFVQTQVQDDSPLEGKLLTRSLNVAQKRVEEKAYQQRKDLFDYDNILNKQRAILYFNRQQILESLQPQKYIIAYGEQVITDLLIEMRKINDQNFTVITIELFKNLFGKNLLVNYGQDSKILFNQLTISELKFYLFKEFWLNYQLKINEFAIYGAKVRKSVIRSIILINIDKIWSEHLQKITLLREAVGWRGYGQRNPLYEYQKEAFSIFENGEILFRQLLIYQFFHSSIV